MRMKVADYVMQRLAAETRHVFFLPGGGCMHLVEALRTQQALSPVVCLHEQAAAIAADAYSQYTGGIGAALVTAGPGSTNAITGVAASWIDSIPVVVVSGQAKTGELIADWHVRQMGVQEVDITALVAPITKYAALVREPESIRRHLDDALAACRSGRPGPVWIDVPLDVQGATVQTEGLEPGGDGCESGPGEAELAQAAAATAQLIAEARRPVVLAGNGVRQAGAVREFLAWLEAVGLPLLTTWKAADFVANDHPLFVGRPGSVGQRAANFAQQTADLVIVLGARLDLAQIGFDSAGFAPRARKVVVDADADELAKLRFDMTVAVQGDAGVFLRQLSAHSTVWKDRDGWLARCREWRRRWPVIPEGSHDQTGLVDTYALVDVLSEELSEEDVFVPGSSGGCAEITLQAFRVKAGQRVFNSPGLGSMGFGLPASIGAAVASGRRVVSVIGDGGLQHNVQELQTLRRLGLPVKLFVLNNDGYGSIRSSQRHHFGGLLAADASSGLTLPDLQDLARAYRLTAFRVEANAELAEGVRRALSEPGPVFCELMVQPDVATQPRLATTVDPDGRILSSPFEDLWPFLDRGEFAAIMDG